MTKALTKSPTLKFPRFQLGYAAHIGKGGSVHAGLGSSQRIFSASITPITDQFKIMTCKHIIFSASVDNSADGAAFTGSVGTSSINISKVYYQTPAAAWRFFGGYAIQTVGNLSTYGSYADDSTFADCTKLGKIDLQAINYEDNLRVRASHYFV